MFFVFVLIYTTYFLYSFNVLLMSYLSFSFSFFVFMQRLQVLSYHFYMPIKNKKQQNKSSSKSKVEKKYSFRKLSDAELRLLEAQISANIPAKDIAKQLAIHTSTVYNYKNKMLAAGKNGQLDTATIEELKKNLVHKMLKTADTALDLMTVAELSKMNAFQLSGIAGNMVEKGMQASKSIENSSIVNKIVSVLCSESWLQQKNTHNSTPKDPREVVIEPEDEECNTLKLKKPDQDPGGAPPDRNETPTSSNTNPPTHSQPQNKKGDKCTK